LDGYLEAGIAAGVDGTLPDADKLPVFGSSADEIYNNALAWALTKDFRNEVTNNFFLCGIAVVTGSGFLRTKAGDGTPDGDWYEASSGMDLPDEAVPTIGEILTKDNLSTAVTVICATKVNYWLMNHHVGQPGKGMLQQVMCRKY
jgi:hypothetical protein